MTSTGQGPRRGRRLPRRTTPPQVPAEQQEEFSRLHLRRDAAREPLERAEIELQLGERWLQLPAGAPEARRCYATARRLLEQAGLPPGAGRRRAAVQGGIVAAQALGETAEALELLAQLQIEAEQAHDEGAALAAVFTRAGLLQALGREAEAEPWWQQCATRAAGSGMVGIEAQALCQLAQRALAAAGPDEAAPLARRAVELASAAQDGSTLLAATRILVLAERQQGRPAAAAAACATGQVWLAGLAGYDAALAARLLEPLRAAGFDVPDPGSRAPGR